MASNSLNNTGEQGVAHTHRFICTNLENVGEIQLQFHNAMMEAPNAILKTAGLLAKITDSDIIQVPLRGSVKGLQPR